MFLSVLDQFILLSHIETSDLTLPGRGICPFIEFFHIFGLLRVANNGYPLNHWWTTTMRLNFKVVLQARNLVKLPVHCSFVDVSLVPLMLQAI